MRRGRRPKPTALRIAQGNPGKRPIEQLTAVEQAAAATSSAISKSQASSIPVPAELVNEGAIEIWQRLTWRLAGLNFVQATDADALARYCSYLSTWYQLAAKLNVKKLVVKTKSAQVEMDRLDRKFQAMLLLDKRLESLEDRFGLNPQARHQLLRDKFNTGRGAPGQLPGIDPPKSDDKPAAEAPAQAEQPSASSSIGALKTARPPHMNN